MKKFKSLLAVFLISTLLVGCTMFFCNTAKAYDETIEDYIFAVAKNEYEFNDREFLWVYQNNSTGNPMNLNHRHSASDSGLHPIFSYVDCDDINTTKRDDESDWSDGKIEASDATNILGLSRVSGEHHVEETKEGNEAIWVYKTNGLRFSLADDLNVDRSKVHIKVTVRTPEVEEYGVNAESFTINDNTKITDEIWETIIRLKQQNKRIHDEVVGEDEEAAVVLQFVSVEAYVEGKEDVIYDLLIADDNNFYFKARNEETKEFKTELEYSSVVEGKLSDGIYYVPYYDDKNSKKDLDATATIKSTTDEEIVSTNGVEMKVDGTANSEGWFYPDVENKKVIAKVYPFDTYDNKIDNGKVSETVALVGSKGGEDVQNPHIEWTFRIKTVDEKTNSDGSITYTITYNLPVDKDSIPSDWSPIFDEDGETIHKITKTVKKGENYKKDVTVKQNGSDATATTTVEKVWNLPNTGDMWIIAVAAIAILVVFAITRRNKLK